MSIDHTTEIRNGIEWYQLDREDGTKEADCQCARCGGSCSYWQCPDCDEYGYSYHDCGEDSCCCRYPENNVCCDTCGGTGGEWHCANTPDYCNAHPLPGRENIESTALNAQAWRDAE